MYTDLLTNKMIELELDTIKRNDLAFNKFAFFCNLYFPQDSKILDIAISTCY